MSRMFCVFSIFCLCGLTSCHNKQNKSTAHLQKEQTLNRPIVAIVPLTNKTQTHLTWDVSQEITSSLRDHVAKRNLFYLVSEETLKPFLHRLEKTNDPFGSDLTWVKKKFPEQEFVVFTELLEHEENSLTQDSPAELKISLRVCVVDVRKQEPKVVLQEVVDKIQQLPKPFDKQNFSQVAWGHEMYPISPLGMAHTQLTEELTARIEDYILLSGRE